MHPPDWHPRIRAIAEQTAGYYDDVHGLSTQEADKLQIEIEKELTRFVDGATFATTTTYATVSDEADTITRGSDCLQRLAELVALAHTGKISPSSNTHYPTQIQSITVDTPQRDMARQTVKAISEGQLRLASLPHNANHHGATGMLIAANKHDNPYSEPLILVFAKTKDGSPLASAAHDSRDMITVLHEAAHHFDETDGTPIQRTRDGHMTPMAELLTEYKAYYHELMTAHGNSIPRSELAAAFKSLCRDMFLDADWGYPGIVAYLQSNLMMADRFEKVYACFDRGVIPTPEQFEILLTSRSPSQVHGTFDALN